MVEGCSLRGGCELPCGDMWGSVWRADIEVAGQGHGCAQSGQGGFIFIDDEDGGSDDVAEDLSA